MSMHLRYAAFSDPGRVRRNNQDSGYASPRLLVVADGMGGAAAGDLASSVAVETVRRIDTGTPPDDLLEVLAGAVQRANDRLAEVVRSDPSVEGMGTTLTVVLADGDRVGLAHVGDSRAYLLRQGELSLLTHDQTLVQGLVDEGKISDEEAKTHPHRSLILQALDGRGVIEPDLEILSLQPGDRLLLCSDGISGFLDDSELATHLGAETVDAAAVELVQAALDARSSDNVTALVAEAVEGDAPAGQSQPMLVGAAAEQARPGGGLADTATQPAVVVDDDEGTGGASDRDLEELRYAPRAPRRFGGLRLVLAVLLALTVLATGAVIAYQWSQSQYYVGAANGSVAIYRGLDQDLPGLDLNSLHEEYPLLLDDIPIFQREELQAGIEADSLADAEDKVAALQQLAKDCLAGIRPCEGVATPTDEPSTSPTPSDDPSQRQGERRRNRDRQGQQR